MDEFTVEEITFLCQLVLNFQTPVREAHTFLKLAQKLEEIALAKQNSNIQEK